MSPTFEQVVQQIEGLPLAEKQALLKLLDKQIADLTDSADVKRQKHKAWLKANRENYGGLYVALEGDQLLGTGKNYPEAFEAAKRAGVKDAFVDFVAPVGYVGETGGW